MLKIQLKPNCNLWPLKNYSTPVKRPLDTSDVRSDVVEDSSESVLNPTTPVSSP